MPPHLLSSCSVSTADFLEHFSLLALFSKGLHLQCGKQAIKGCAGSSFSPLAVSGQRNAGFAALRQLLSWVCCLLGAQVPLLPLYSRFMGRKAVCVRQMRVTVWYGQIGSEQAGTRTQGHPVVCPHSSAKSHLVAIPAAAGEEALDVICRNQAASVVLTYFQLLEHIK